MKFKKKSSYQFWLNNKPKSFVAAGIIFAALIIYFSQLPAMPAAQAAIAPPNIINYQGKLMTLSNVPVSDASADVKFAFYTEGGACLWTAAGNCGALGSVPVSLDSGLFTVILGDTDNGQNAIPDSVFQNNDKVYLGVTINTDSEMTPRKRISAAPYAFNSKYFSGYATDDFLRSNASDNYEGSNDRTMTFISDLSAGNRTLDLFRIIQANDNNYSASIDAHLMAIYQDDVDSAGEVFYIDNSGAGDSLYIKGNSIYQDFVVDRYGRVGIGLPGVPAAKLDIFNMDSPSNIPALKIATSEPNAHVIEVSGGTTTGTMLYINDGFLTTGSMMQLLSSSVATEDRVLVNIVNSSEFADNTLVMRLVQHGEDNILELHNTTGTVFTFTPGSRLGIGVNAGNPAANLDISTNNVASVNANDETIQFLSNQHTVILQNGLTVINQRTNIFKRPVISGTAGGAVETVTNAATVYIEGAPAGDNITFTNGPYSLWIDDGAVRFDSARLDINGVEYTWPAADGAASTVLTTDGAGNLSWTDPNSLGYWALGTYGLYYASDDVIVGADYNLVDNFPLTNTAFNLTGAGNELFVVGDIGASGDIYTNGSFIAGASLTLNDNGITDSNSDINFISSTDGFNFTMASGIGDDFIIKTAATADIFVVEGDTGNIGIGTAAPTNYVEFALGATDRIYVDGATTTQTGDTGLMHLKMISEPDNNVAGLRVDIESDGSLPADRALLAYLATINAHSGDGAGSMYFGYAVRPDLGMASSDWGGGDYFAFANIANDSFFVPNISGDVQAYGLYNFMKHTGSGSLRGISQTLNHTAGGDIYGIESNLTASGSGDVYGENVSLSLNGASGNAYAQYYTLTNGILNSFIDMNVSGGTAYYGLDMSGAAFASADIVFQNGEFLHNIDVGFLTLTGGIFEVERAGYAEFFRLYDTTNSDFAGLFTGGGTPNGNATGSVGSLYLDHDASGDVYLKTTDAVNTGWVKLGLASGDWQNFDEVYAQSVLDGDLSMEIDNASGLIFNLTTSGGFIIADGGTPFATFKDNGDVFFSNNLFIGAESESILNGGFAMGGDDLFVLGQIGASEDIFTNGEFIAGASLHLGDNRIYDTNGPINVMPNDTDDYFGFSSNGTALTLSTIGESNLTIAPSGDSLIFKNSIDSVTGIQFLDTDGGSPIVNIDTFNERVGIGIPNPYGKLDVLYNSTDTAAYAVRIYNNDSGASQGGGLLIADGPNLTSGYLVNIDATSNLTTYGQIFGVNFKPTALTYTGSLDKDGLRFFYEPTYAANVNGTVTANAIDIYRKISTAAGTGIVNVTGALAWYKDDLGTGTVNNSADVIKAEQRVTNNTGAGLRIIYSGTGYAVYVDDESGSDTTPFVIDDNGEVGIGTNNPGAWLDINASQYSEFVRLYDTSNSDFAGLFTGGGTPNGFATGSVGSLYLDHDASGDVYLKTTDAVNTGWVKLSLASGDWQNFDEVYAQSVLDGDLSMEIDDASGLTFNLTTSGGFIIADGGTPFATFKDNGDVFFSNNLFIGAEVEGILNNDFAMTGQDLFASGDIGAGNNVFANGEFIAGLSLRLGDDWIYDTNGPINLMPNDDSVNYFVFDSDGTNLELQTTDEADLSIKPAGDQLIFKNSINSTSGYQFQNVSETSIMTVDTTNSLVGIGAAPLLYNKLYVYRASGDYGPNHTSIYGYRYGSSGVGSGGNGWGVSAIDAAVKGYSFFGNQFTAGVAAYSYLDYANSTALIASDYTTNLRAMLAYKDGSSNSWAGYFVGAVKIEDTSTTGNSLVITSSNTTVNVVDISSANTAGSVEAIAWPAAKTQTANLYGMSIDMVNVTPSANSGHTLAGIYLNNPFSDTAANAYGLYVAGTNWDYGIYSVDKVKFDGTTTLNNVEYTWPSLGASVDGYVLSSTTGGILSWTDVNSLGYWELGVNGGIYEDDYGVIVGGDASADAAMLNVSAFGGSFGINDLFVVSDIGASGDIYTNGSFIAGASLTLNDNGITDSNSDINFVSSTNGFIFTTDADASDDFVINTNKFVLEGDTGNIGIGTAAPISKVDVKLGAEEYMYIDANTTAHTANQGALFVDFRGEPATGDMLMSGIKVSLQSNTGLIAGALFAHDTEISFRDVDTGGAVVGYLARTASGLTGGDWGGADFYGMGTLSRSGFVGSDVDGDATAYASYNVMTHNGAGDLKAFVAELIHNGSGKLEAADFILESTGTGRVEGVNVDITLSSNYGGDEVLGSKVNINNVSSSLADLVIKGGDVIVTNGAGNTIKDLIGFSVTLNNNGTVSGNQDVLQLKVTGATADRVIWFDGDGGVADYGIDMRDITIASADIVLSNGERIINTSNDTIIFMNDSQDNGFGVMLSNGNPWLVSGLSTEIEVRDQLIVSSELPDTNYVLKLENDDGDFAFFNTNANPNSVITGSPGDIAVDSTNGVIWWKASGSATNTGWLTLADPDALWQMGTLGIYYASEDVIVGANISDETPLVNTAFSLAGDGNKLYVESDLGVGGNVYTDNEFIAGASLYLGDGRIYDSNTAINLMPNGSTQDYFVFDSNLTDLTLSTFGDSDLTIAPSGNQLIFQNSIDSVTGIQFLDADGGMPIVNIDTSGERVGIGTAAPGAQFEIETSLATTSFLIDDNNASGYSMSIESVNTTVNTVYISAANTTMNAVYISASALTTGSGINLYSASTSTSARNLLYVRNAQSSAIQAIPIAVEQNSIANALKLTHVNASTAAADVSALDITMTDTGVVSSGSDIDRGINVNLTRTGAATGSLVSAYGVYSKVTSDSGGGAATYSYGLYSEPTGADYNIGGYFYVAGTSPSSINMGVRSEVSAENANENRAGYFTATNATYNYALITNSGDVGLGDLSPDARLEVSADGSTSGDLFMLSSNDNNDGDYMTVERDGQVLIGTGSAFSANDTVTIYRSSTSATAATEQALYVEFSDSGNVASGSDISKGIGVSVTRSGITGGAGSAITKGITISALGDLGSTTFTSMYGLDVYSYGADYNYGGYFVSQGVSGSVSNYGIYSWTNGASTNNIAGYFAAEGGTNNYAMIVPSGKGQVGIGTSNPQGLLHVVQDDSDLLPAAYFQYNIDTDYQPYRSAVIIDMDRSGNTSAAGGSDALVIWLDRDGTGATYPMENAGIRSIVNGTDGTGSAAAKNFGGYFSATGGTYNYALVTYLGNVGIGTIAPDYLLDVNGAAGFNDYLYHNDDTNDDTWMKFDENQVDFVINNTNALNLKTNEAVFNEDGYSRDFRVEATGGAATAFYVEGKSGQVGMGTGVPNYQLHLKGLSTSSYPRIALENSDTTINGDTLGEIYFAGYDNSATKVGAYIKALSNGDWVNGDDESAPTQLSFYVENSDATYAEIAAPRMVIGDAVELHGLRNPTYTTSIDLQLHRNDSTVIANEYIGEISFIGKGTTYLNSKGAQIIAVASNSWDSAQYDQPTDLKFYTQSDGATNDMVYPRLTINSAGTTLLTPSSPGGGITPIARAGLQLVSHSSAPKDLVILSGDPSDGTDFESGIYFADYNNAVGHSAKIYFDAEQYLKIYVDSVVGGNVEMLRIDNTAVRIGDNANANNIDLLIGDGGICIDNDGSCTAPTDGGLRLDLPAAGTGYAICHSGTNNQTDQVDVVDCTSTPSADYQEMYPVAVDVTAGDLVVPGSTVVTTMATEDLRQLVKTSQPYENNIIGVMSNPADMGDFNTIGHNIRAEDNPQPIALAGRVTVKVNDENGAINVGDPITSSSTPGVGMKSTKPGMVVGYALDDYTGAGQGAILMLVVPGWESGDTILTDGNLILMNDDFIANATGTAAAGAQGYDSYKKTYRGSGWDGAAAQTVDMSIFNKVTNSSDYKVVFENNDNAEVASINQNGDLRAAGTIAAGGTAVRSYNSISSGSAASQVSASNDLFVEGDLEVGGTIYANVIGSNTWTSGTNALYFSTNNVAVGENPASTQPLNNSNFVLTGDDLYVKGLIGAKGSLYSDASFVAGTDTTYGSGSVSSTGAMTVASGGGSDLSLDSASGNLKLGAGTNTISNTDALTDLLINATGNINLFSSATSFSNTGNLVMNNGTIAVGGVGSQNYNALASSADAVLAAGSSDLYVGNVLEVGGESFFSGPVGIGRLSSGDAALTVQGALCVDDGTDSCPATSNAGWIYAEAAAVTEIDLAENYQSNQSLTPGEVVVADPANSEKIIKSTGSYQSGMMGVVSTSPGLLLGSNISSAYPVALAGRVPVKVNDENGSILPGDLLTSSSTPGQAMKATQAGPIIGKALEPLAAGEGTITVFVETGWYGGNVYTTDGAASYVNDDQVFTATNTATELAPNHDSYKLTLRGSAWDGASAQDIDFSLMTAVDASGDYELSFLNDNGAKVASLTGDGDLNVLGKFYPSAAGGLQSDYYIFYDSDYMRTNASGWGSGAFDVAEMFVSYQKLEAGELVTTGQYNEYVERSSSPYDAQLVGIVSTKPGYLGGLNVEFDDNSPDRGFPVALAGRVPTKVSAENGPIAIGDMITSSSIPGVGMKATTPGTVVGMALESFNGAGQGKIVVFVNVGWFDGEKVEAFQPAETTLTVDSLISNGDIFMNGNKIIAVSEIIGADNKWAIDANGVLRFEAATAEDGTVREVYGMSATTVEITASGSAAMVNGEVEILFDNVDPGFAAAVSADVPLKIIVTPTSQSNGLYVAEKKVAEVNGKLQHAGFTVKELGEASSGVTFDWIAIGRRVGYETQGLDMLETVQDLSTEDSAEVQAAAETSADSSGSGSGEPMTDDSGAADEETTDTATSDAGASDSGGTGTGDSDSAAEPMDSAPAASTEPVAATEEPAAVEPVDTVQDPAATEPIDTVQEPAATESPAEPEI